MKTTNLVTGLSLLVASFVLTFNANGQSYLQIKQKNPTSGALEACRTVDTFTLIIKNISAVTLSNMDVLPTSSNVGIVYGGFMGVSSGTVTMISTNPMQFNIPILAAGDSVLLRYTAKAICSALTNISGNTAINYANVSFDVSGIGRTSESLTTAVSYNLLYPRLDIVVVGNPQTLLDNTKVGDFCSFPFGGTVGSLRDIQVSNTGTGPVDTVIIRITPEPEIKYNGFWSNTGIFIPANYVGSEVVIILQGTTLFSFMQTDLDGTSTFVQGEIITLVEDFDVIACGAENELTDYYVESACFGTNCSVPGNNYDDGNVGAVSGTPNLKITTGNKTEVTSYCSDDGEIEFYFANTAKDFGDYAANLLLDVISYGNTLPSGFILYDFEINDQLLPLAMVTAVPLIQWHNIAANQNPGYRIDLSSNTSSLIALDWDNDSQFDDLGAGQILKLTAKIKFDVVQPFESQCPINYFSRLGLPQVKYESSCNNTEHKLNATGQVSPLNNSYYDAYIRTNSGFNGSINGANDVVEGVIEVFEFCTGSYQTTMEFFKCPVDSFYAEIILPDGYALIGTTGIFTSDFGGSENLIASSDGDIITIFGGGHSTSGAKTQWWGCYSVPLIMDCSLSSTGTIPDTSTLSWRMNYICDTCNIVQHRVCDDFTTYNHSSCGVASSCPGIVSIDFNADRTSFGYTDHTMTSKVTSTISGLELNAAYAHDTIKTSTSGLVRSNDIDRLFCEIRVGAPDIPFKWLNGVFFLTDALGNVLPNCPITTPPFITGIAPNYVYTFEIPFSCYGAMGAGFKVSLVNNWQINDAAANQYGKETKFTPFRSGFYNMRNDSIFACDEWGTDFKLYSVNTYPWVDEQGGVGCNDLKIRMYMTNLGGSSGNDFPNEYRPVIQIDNKITFHIPIGHEYIGNASTINIIGVSAAGTPVNTQIPLTPIFIDADSVVFEYPWVLIDKYNMGSTSDSILPLLQFSLKPDCNRDQTMQTILDYGYNRYYYTGKLSSYKHENYTFDPNYGAGGYNVNHVNTKANITVNTGAYIVDGYTKTVKWNITVCNKTDVTHPTVTGASFVWIDIQNVPGNVGNITINRFYATGSIPQNAINYLDGSDENSYIQLGALSAKVCKSFTLEGSYIGCDPENLDSLSLITAWNCTGYPDVGALDTATCQVAEDVLALRYKLSNLDMLVLQAPTVAVDICDTLHYLVQLESTANAFMYNVNFWAELPTGASLINGEYNYIVSDSSWRGLPTPVNSFSNTNSKGWHLSQILSEWSQYGGGFIGAQKPDSAKIQLRFDIVLNCDYNPNDSIVLYSSGKTNCNDSIYLYNIQRILINGFTDLDRLNVSVAMPDTLKCNEAGRIDVSITNLNPTPNQFEDSLKVEIPNYFVIVNTLPFGASIQTGATGTNVKWKIPPSSIAGGASTTYSIFVMGNTVLECTTIEIPTTVYYVGSSICGQTVCNPTAIIDQADSSIVLCCIPCFVNAEFISDSVCISDCCGSDTTCFKLIDQTSIGTDYIHFWDFGDTLNSTDAEPCHQYDSARVYYACHTITQISTGCFITYCDSVRVYDTPIGAIELLGCSPFCKGDTVYLTVNATPVGGQGTYTCIEWIELPSGAVVGTGDTLTVTKEGQYNAILTNGVCTSECLAIDLKIQLIPEIGIPDTAFCIGDSILLCTGSQFTTYEWQKNGIVFNSEDSCIYISSPGQYIITVGQKFPFGCYTCKGTDTFNVILNTIEVTLPDLGLCGSENQTLCATVSGGYAPYTYLWQPNGEITPCITVNTAGDYIVAVTSANCTAVDTGTVTIDLPSNAEFSYNDTICLNSEFCFESINSDTHYWEVSDSTGAVIRSDSLNPFCYLFNYVGTFSVKHIHTNPCNADTVTHVVEVVAPIEACIELIGKNPFCAGDTVCLTTSDPFNQISQTEWYLNDVLVYVGDSLCVTEPGTYIARVTDYRGCVSECICIVLKQNPNPIINLPPDATFCADSTYTLDAGKGFAEYHWYKNGLPYSFGTSSITVTTFGTYKVEVTDTNGCKATDTTVVSPFISTSYNIVSSDIFVCQGESFVLSTTYNTNYTYEWFKQAEKGEQVWHSIANSDTNILNQNYTNLYVSKNTLYMVLITDVTSGCVFEAFITIMRDNCLEIMIFPNPVIDNTITIRYDIIGSGYSGVVFEFRNMIGQLVAAFPVDLTVQEAIFDISALASGFYNLSLIANDVAVDCKYVVIAR